jgi:aspartyl-tRNA(Asn)/glutamyl-tRNA(Gln) amidotransferase subunit A
VDLTNLTLHEASKLIERRQVSPVELTEAYLSRIGALDRTLNAFITVTADLALARARAAESEIGQGAYRGALHGIPLALKDVFETKGIRTTAGSSFLGDYVPSEDCAVVAKLNRAGAVLLGKLILTEWTLKVTDRQPRYAASKNPWGLTQLTGGSSSGSGAAVAGRLCLSSLATDTGGSIRIPASYCGVVGLKPTFGRVSTSGVIPLSWPLDHVGPMARRVADVACLLQAIAGYDAADPNSVDRPVDDYLTELPGGVAGWRIALASGKLVELADTGVRDALRQAAVIFGELGASVEEVTLDGPREAWSMYSTILTADAAAYHRQRLEDNPDGFSPDALATLRRGLATSAVDYALARRTQAILRRQCERLFDRYDLILLPTTPTAAPLEQPPVVSTGVVPPPTLFTAYANVVGIPSLSLPCGFTPEGMPIGLQLLAPHFAEAGVFRAGHAFERATAWHNRQPPEELPHTAS